ncbi:hypothetical protein ACSSS7_005830 [Eimeria intestinalis]
MAASMACICGDTSALTLLNLRRRHPHADRPLIDLNAVVFLSPAQIAEGDPSVQICQVQQEQRQPRRTRTQGIASMLDMRVDIGVWLLQPGDEAIETPPPASNVVLPHQHPSSDDERMEGASIQAPGASCVVEAVAE